MMDTWNYNHIKKKFFNKIIQLINKARENWGRRLNFRFTAIISYELVWA